MKKHTVHEVRFIVMEMNKSTMYTVCTYSRELTPSY